MKSTSLSHIFHDIRTPISGIDGMINIAVKHLDDKDRVLDCPYKIESASQYLLSLLNDILESSRIESGKGLEKKTSILLRLFLYSDTAAETDHGARLRALPRLLL